MPPELMHATIQKQHGKVEQGTWGTIISQSHKRRQALCTTFGRARGPHLIRRSPLEDVYRRAHCMYATGPCTTVSSCWMDTANALSGSTCSSARKMLHAWPQENRFDL